MTVDADPVFIRYNDAIQFLSTAPFTIFKMPEATASFTKRKDSFTFKNPLVAKHLANQQPNASEYFARIHFSYSANAVLALTLACSGSTLFLCREGLGVLRTNG